MRQHCLFADRKASADKPAQTYQLELHRGSPAIQPQWLNLAGAVPSLRSEAAAGSAGAPLHVFLARSSAAGKNFRNNLPNRSLRL